MKRHVSKLTIQTPTTEQKLPDLEAWLELGGCCTDCFAVIQGRTQADKSVSVPNLQTVARDESTCGHEVVSGGENPKPCDGPSILPIVKPTN